jgi:soluble cytochrome b562
MRTWGTILAITVAAAITLAVAKDVSIEDLKTRAANARPDERVNLCLEIAERQVKAADKLYNEGNVEAAQAAIRDIVSYSRQAGQAASQTGHHVKNTEIAMRKMTHHLADIKRNVAFENQAPLQTAIETLEKIRTDLLDSMFGKKAK